MGRPSKLTPERQETICRILADGITRIEAAVGAGIDYSTFRAWVRRGRKQDRGQYRSFVEAVNEAESAAAREHLATIRKAASERDEVTVKEIQVREPPSEAYPDGRFVVKRETTTKRVFDWQAAAWWLERRRADDYQKRYTAELAELLAAVDALEKKFAEQQQRAQRQAFG
jgi:hypothetical protein